MNTDNDFERPTLKPQVKICAISDLHEQWGNVQVPACDVLVIAGDLTNTGQWARVKPFCEWLDTLLENDYVKDIVVIAGNHDITAQQDPARFTAMIEGVGAIYLAEESAVVQGLKFFGSPWQPRFGDWAFNASRGTEILTHWKKIPDDVDVLVTHGPPYGVCDEIPDGRHVGCVDLRNEVVARIKPKLLICGHIHHSHGLGLLGTTLVMNAASCNERYKPVNPPLVVTL